MDAIVTKEERLDVEKVEKVMRKWCDTAKGKDKTMCYYLGVGDAESVRRRRCARASAFSVLLPRALRLPASKSSLPSSSGSLTTSMSRWWRLSSRRALRAA